MVDFTLGELLKLADTTKGSGSMTSEEFGLVTDANRKAELIRQIGDWDIPHSFTGNLPADNESIIGKIRVMDADQIISLLLGLELYREDTNRYEFDMQDSINVFIELELLPTDYDDAQSSNVPKWTTNIPQSEWDTRQLSLVD